MTKPEHNKWLQNEYNTLKQDMESKLDALQKQVQPPCEECRYDGVYRCEACGENFFEGFNIRDYPD